MLYDGFLIKLLTRDIRKFLEQQRELIDAIAKRAEADDESARPTPSGTLERVQQEIARVREEINPPPEVINRYYAEQHEAYGLQRASFWISIFTLIALVIYTAFTIKMYWANKEAADAARDAARTAGNALRLTLRPRLTVLNFSGMYDMRDETVGTGPSQTHRQILHPNLIDGKLFVNIDLHNYGPMSARNVRFFRFDSVGVKGQSKQTPYEELSGRPQLFPPRPDIGGIGVEGTRIISAIDLKGLEDGALYATFSVLITYDDDLSDTHHAEYCTVFNFHGFNQPCSWPVRND